MSNPDFESECLRRTKEFVLKGLGRRIQPIRPKENGVVALPGKEAVSFCSNDYLGISARKEILEAVKKSLSLGYFGSTGSRLLSGGRNSHGDLERELAEWLGYESCLLYNSGYQANIGVLSSILSERDCVVFDREVHASIIDGCRLSKAKLMVYPHLDYMAAARLMARASNRYGRVVLVTESLFSMSGRVAPLKELELSVQESNSVFYVDEAHALGVFGEQGRGLCHEMGVHPDILVGTSGKALGTSGAFVMALGVVRDLLVNTSRAFIFSTAMPASSCRATSEAIRLVASQEGEKLRQRLVSNIQVFHKALGWKEPVRPSPIVPILIGDASNTVALSEKLLAQGFWVPAIRPPTVAEGSCRLRVSISASHLEEQLEGLAELLRKNGVPDGSVDP